MDGFIDELRTLLILSLPKTPPLDTAALGTKPSTQELLRDVPDTGCNSHHPTPTDVALGLYCN